MVWTGNYCTSASRVTCTGATMLSIYIITVCIQWPMENDSIMVPARMSGLCSSFMPSAMQMVHDGRRPVFRTHNEKNQWLGQSSLIPPWSVCQSGELFHKKKPATRRKTASCIIMEHTGKDQYTPGVRVQWRSAICQQHARTMQVNLHAVPRSCLMITW